MFGHLQIKKGWQPGFVKAKTAETLFGVYWCEMIIPETTILSIKKINTLGSSM